MKSNSTKELLVATAIVGFTLWAGISLVGSTVKATTDNYTGENNCGKTYPIDYVIYTNLFCEIKQ